MENHEFRGAVCNTFKFCRLLASFISCKNARGLVDGAAPSLTGSQLVCALSSFCRGLRWENGQQEDLLPAERRKLLTSKGSRAVLTEHRHLQRGAGSKEAVLKWPPAVRQTFWAGLFPVHSSLLPHLLHSLWCFFPPAGTGSKTPSTASQLCWQPVGSGTGQKLRSALGFGIWEISGTEKWEFFF